MMRLFSFWWAYKTVSFPVPPGYQHTHLCWSDTTFPVLSTQYLLLIVLDYLRGTGCTDVKIHAFPGTKLDRLSALCSSPSNLSEVLENLSTKEVASLAQGRNSSTSLWPSTEFSIQLAKNYQLPESTQTLWAPYERFLAPIPSSNRSSQEKIIWVVIFSDHINGYIYLGVAWSSVLSHLTGLLFSEICIHV